MPDPLWWLTYRVKNDVVVFIQPAFYEVAARLKAQIAGVEEEFQEGYLLDQKTSKRIPLTHISRPLSQKEAAALLRKME